MFLDAVLQMAFTVLFGTTKPKDAPVTTQPATISQPESKEAK